MNFFNGIVDGLAVYNFYDIGVAVGHISPIILVAGILVYIAFKVTDY